MSGFDRVDEVKGLRDMCDALLFRAETAERDRDAARLAVLTTQGVAKSDRRRAEEAERAEELWLSWSDGRYPDDSAGDVIAADVDGTIVLDDAITTWNPLRALAFKQAEMDRLRAAAEMDRLRAAAVHLVDCYHRESEDALINAIIALRLVTYGEQP